MKNLKLKNIIQEADYSFDNIRINVYDDVNEIDITSGSGSKITLKHSQIRKLIDKLKIISNNFAKSNMTFPRD